MATIENLGGAFVRMAAQLVAREQTVPAKSRTTVAERPLPTQGRSEHVRGSVEATSFRGTSPGRGRANEKTQRQKQLSLEELAEVLRKVNLRFDLFEIQAKFTVSRQTGEVTIEVINQRTGEVIRKIPPYAVSQVLQSMKDGSPVITDVEA